MKQIKIYKAEDLIERLRIKYEANSSYKVHSRYVFLEQVASATGWQNQGWIDAIVLSLWPSDGLTRRAFEIKVSRSDFLSELQKPLKNQWAREYCHEFWYVAPKDVVKESELSEGIGWMCPHGDSLRIVRHAVRQQVKVDDEFIASLSRSLIKEYNKKIQNVKQNIKSNDEDFKQAIVYQKAVQRFLNENKMILYKVHYSEDDIYKYLCSANIDSKKIEKQNKQIAYSVQTFQDQLFKLWNMMTVLAFVGITETDDMGNFLMNNFRDEQINTLAIRRARDGKWYKNERNWNRKSLKQQDKIIRQQWELMMDTLQTLMKGEKDG